MQLLRTVVLTAVLPFFGASQLASGTTCSTDYNVCAPTGAATNTLGPIDANWADLYDSIVNLVSNFSVTDVASTSTVDPNGPARRDVAFCCSNYATCLLVPGYDIPMCWDRWTTNVFFPDGTYGSVISGDFNTSEGDSINLVYGDYTMKDGDKGNIYSGAAMSTMKPDTSTLPVPTPWTSSGVGSAIAATSLGTMASLSTGTITIPATTEPPSTGESITIIATMTGCGHCPEWNTTIAGPTQSGGTQPATTSTFTTGIITPTITAASLASMTRVNPALSFAAALVIYCAINI